MDIAVMVGQLVLSLSILIILHEGGHFIPSRLFGTRVEKFYLFFDAWGKKLFSKKIGDTEYGIGWLPLGGYVKISGMIDESMDTEQMKQPAQDWEFRSKPAWQRLIIMLGGVTVNFFLGLFIFGMVLFVWGEEYLPADQVTYGIHADSLGLELGLQHGDQIVAIGEKRTEKFNPRKAYLDIILGDAQSMTVNRGGREISIPVDEETAARLATFANQGPSLYSARIPFQIAQVQDGLPAAKAGLKPDDQIISVDNQPTPYWQDFQQTMKGKSEASIVLGLIRDGDTMNISLTTTEKGMIGVFPYQNPDHFFQTERMDYSFGSALAAGSRRGITFLSDQLKAFGQMFRGKIKASDSLGGFGTITSLFPTTWNWEAFWEITAILSLILALMNLLPIPALDGGHVMFLLYEVATGRKPSDKFMEYATLIGFIIIIALVIYANGLDLYRFLSK
jgi:regulator of sigma E protease